jgi:predicted transcriptional regulator
MMSRRHDETEGAGADEGRIPEVLMLEIQQGKNAVKTLRKWRGLTQAVLASEAAIGKGYLTDIEAGRRKGGPETLKALAEALGVPRSLLLG